MTSLPVTRDPNSSCLSVAQNATRNKECLLGPVGIRYPACAWGLILIFYSPKKVCSSLTTGTQWTRGLAFYRTHTLEESTHTAARTLVPFLQMKARPSKGTCDSLFPKCRHSTLLVTERPRDGG